MSTITYHIGSKEYTFYSNIQLKDIPLIAVEENLNNEIKIDLKKRGIHDCIVRNIVLSDDNGIKASVDSLSEIGKLKLI